MLGTSLRLLLVIVKDTFTISYYSDWLYSFIMPSPYPWSIDLKLSTKKLSPKAQFFYYPKR